jgi:GDPmannose 4,6-dehydratase
MWLMLQQDKADDYVIGTGEVHSVKEFVEAAFAYANLDWQAHVEIDPRYFRPTEVAALQADSSKARRQLGWEARVKFHELVAIMVDAELVTVGLQPIGDASRILAANFSQWHQPAVGITTVCENELRHFE